MNRLLLVILALLAISTFAFRIRQDGQDAAAAPAEVTQENVQDAMEAVNMTPEQIDEAMEAVSDEDCDEAHDDTAEAGDVSEDAE